MHGVRNLLRAFGGCVGIKRGMDFNRRTTQGTIHPHNRLPLFLLKEQDVGWRAGACCLCCFLLTQYIRIYSESIKFVWGEISETTTWQKRIYCDAHHLSHLQSNAEKNSSNSSYWSAVDGNSIPDPNWRVTWIDWTFHGALMINCIRKRFNLINR